MTFKATVCIHTIQTVHGMKAPGQFAQWQRQNFSEMWKKSGNLPLKLCSLRKHRTISELSACVKVQEKRHGTGLSFWGAGERVVRRNKGSTLMKFTWFYNKMSVEGEQCKYWCLYRGNVGCLSHAYSMIILISIHNNKIKKNLFYSDSLLETLHHCTFILTWFHNYTCV